MHWNRRPVKSLKTEKFENKTRDTINSVTKFLHFLLVLNIKAGNNNLRAVI